eukprot:1759467-Prorocentrum_lima.AAC.1
MLWVRCLGVVVDDLSYVPLQDLDMNVGGPRAPPEVPMSPPSPPSTTGATGAPSGRSFPDPRS